MSDSLQPHGLQHPRLPCPSPSPGVCPSSCPLHRWWHPTNSSSVTLFSFCLQSFQASGSFPVTWLFALGGQSIGASASVLPVNIQGWSPCCPGNSQESSPAPQFESLNSLALSLYGPALTTVCGYWKVLTVWTFVCKVMSLLFNTLSRFVIAFLPRSSCLLFMAAVILEPKKKKSITASTFSLSICHEVMGPDATILVF